MKVPAHFDQTIVTAHGEVLHQGNGNDGVIIVDWQTRKPVMMIGEVSDDETVNLFIEIPEEAGRLDSEPPVGFKDNQQFEVLVNRANHLPIEKMKGE